MGRWFIALQRFFPQKKCLESITSPENLPIPANMLHLWRIRIPVIWFSCLMILMMFMIYFTYIYNISIRHDVYITFMNYVRVIYIFHRISYISSEQCKKTWLFRVYRGWHPTQFCGDYFINHYKHPYETTNIQWKVRPFFFFAAHLHPWKLTWFT